MPGSGVGGGARGTVSALLLLRTEPQAGHCHGDTAPIPGVQVQSTALSLLPQDCLNTSFPLFLILTLLCASVSPSDQGWEERQEEDNLLIERVLLLVRNVLHVPADLEQEKVIWGCLSSHAWLG